MDIVKDSPIIAAVKNEKELRHALQSECETVFLLFGSLLSVDELVKKIKESGKTAIVHIDLIEGLGNNDIAVDFLKKYCSPDGIISTKVSMIKRAKKLGLTTVHRMFIIDSLSIGNIKTVLDAGNPDYVEILPGIIPKAIEEICETVSIPVITGGLIKKKEEVIAALNAGAAAVSTSCEEVWGM